MQKSPLHIPAVINLEQEQGYMTSDLFMPHPTAKETWYLVGRQDDVIVHSTGEKTVPTPFEDIISEFQSWKTSGILTHLLQMRVRLCSELSCLARVGIMLEF